MSPFQNRGAYSRNIVHLTNRLPYNSQDNDSMTHTLDFTAQEWDVLERAPMLAGLLVGDLANPTSWLPELYAVFNHAHALASNSKSVLVLAVTERMLARDGESIDLPVDLPQSSSAARAYLIAGCLQAMRLVSQKAPSEVEPFRQWLLHLARTAAASTKEGGFLGIGGQQISNAERTILHELETALNLVG